MSQFLKKYDKGERVFDAIIVFTLVSLGFIQVIARYVFNFPLAWSEETMLFLYVWMVYIGSAAGVTSEKHVSVDLFINFFPPLIRKIDKIIVDLLWMAYCVFLMRSAVSMFEYVFTRKTATIGAHIPYWVGYAAIMLGCVLMFARLVHKMVTKDIPELANKGKEDNK